MRGKVAYKATTNIQLSLPITNEVNTPFGYFCPSPDMVKVVFLWVPLNI